MLSGAIHFTGRKVCREGGRILNPAYAPISTAVEIGKGSLSIGLRITCTNNIGPHERPLCVRFAAVLLALRRVPGTWWVLNKNLTNDGQSVWPLMSFQRITFKNI